MPVAPAVTGEVERTKPEARHVYPALDGLRTIAFAMVFCQHYNVLPWGWTGVELFFVLSGFLITGILYDSRNDRFKVWNFYVRRSLRIFPLYYGVMLMLLVVWPWLRWEVPLSWIAWPLYLGNMSRFMHPHAYGSVGQWQADFQVISPRFFGGTRPAVYLGHFWTLCVEEQFYLMWPAVVFWVRDRRKLLWICLGSVPVCLGLRLWGQHTFATWLLEESVLSHATPLVIDSLLTGGAVALLLRGGGAEGLRWVGRWVGPVALLGAFVWAYLLPGHFLVGWTYPYPRWTETWGLTAIEALSALVILLCIQTGNALGWFLSRKPLRWVGRLTYGAYVFHDIPHPLYKRLGELLSPRHADLAMNMIALAGTLLLSWLSFRFFESYFLGLKERWTRQPSTQT